MTKGPMGNPVVVQSDRTVLLEVRNPLYEEARDRLARFAELVKSPEYVHTYRITPLSLWNAAASGLSEDAIIDTLQVYSRYPLPDNVRVDIADYVSRYGRVKLIRSGSDLLLEADNPHLLAELSRHRQLSPHVSEHIDSLHLRIAQSKRGQVKQTLVSIGYPAQDLAGYVRGAPLTLRLATVSRSGDPFQLRPYQLDALSAFHAAGGTAGGSGVVVLPCGSGKTIVGIAAISALQCATLILTTNTVAARQWMDELLDKTDLQADSVGEYSGLRKQVRAVTVATYQIMTYRARGHSDSDESAQAYPHFALFNERDWGLVIYDEVHLLPAPVFRITAEIQARRRLGLTATLVREDGREVDVFSLIGPTKYDAPWKDLERQGWIAAAACHEIRIDLPHDLRLEYALSDKRSKYRVAAENPRKLGVLDHLLERHASDSVLIIGMYLRQLREIASRYGLELITGKTPVADRQALYDAFRQGQIRRLVLSKVGNFAVDLPDANVAIQVSGTFGSRQEEAQRLGRILRPKHNGSLAHFYTLVSRETRDQDYAAKRQLYLTEQGYRYDIHYEEELVNWEPCAAASEVKPESAPALRSKYTR